MCLAADIVVPLKVVNGVPEWQLSQGVVFEGMCLATIGFGGSLLL